MDQFSIPRGASAWPTLDYIAWLGGDQRSTATARTSRPLKPRSTLPRWLKLASTQEVPKMHRSRLIIGLESTGTREAALDNGHPQQASNRT